MTTSQIHTIYTNIFGIGRFYVYFFVKCDMVNLSDSPPLFTCGSQIE